MLLLAALGWLSTLPRAYDGLMLVRHSSASRGGIPSDTVQALREEGLLFAYEIPTPATAEVLGTNHRVTLIGTGSAYLEISGHRLISGAFFTQPAWESQSRFATLNSAAAFAIFGSVNIDGLTIIIDGQTWVVTGVIDDAQTEALNIYAPSSVTGGTARSLLVRTQSGPAGWAYAQNTLAGFGIREGEYELSNLSRVAEASGERFALAWKSTLCLALILLGAKGLSLIKAACLCIAGELSHHYLRKALRLRRAEVAKAVWVAAFLATGAALVMNLLLRILAILFGWRDISPPQWYPNVDFPAIISWLEYHHTLGLWLLALYLLAALAAAISWSRKAA